MNGRTVTDRELLEGALRDAEQLVELTKPDLEEEVRQALESYNQAVNNYRRVKREMQAKREAMESAALRSIRRAALIAIVPAIVAVIFLMAVIL
jgi:vacuolar-type H+-ATPase subunit E/Vma4